MPNIVINGQKLRSTEDMKTQQEANFRTKELNEEFKNFLTEFNNRIETRQKRQ